MVIQQCVRRCPRGHERVASCR